MENHPKEITYIQAIMVMISTIIGVGVLPLPRLASQAAQSGAPMVTLLAIIVGYVGVVLLTVLAKRFPGMTIITYAKRVLGRPLAIITSSAVILFFIILTSLAAREFGEVVITSVLMETPLEVTVLVMLLITAMSTRHDLKTFAYIHMFYTPIIFGAVLFIALLSFKNANWLYLQPIWGYEYGYFLPGVLTVSALLQGSFVFTMIIPNMRQPQTALKAGTWGLAISGGLYVLIVSATVAVFGPRETIKMLWPTLELAKATALPANILERLDALFLSVWVTAVFTTLLSSYYLVVYSIRQLLNMQDHRMLSYGLLPIIFVIAMQPQNVQQLYKVIEVFGMLGLIITIGYPAILIVIAAIRQVRGEPHADKTV